ncbi:MAG TPA: glycosyltransferase [Pyrinomonadaceae bacterium]|jgi:glycosyltransferase involved in cell wall biosynthesis
MKERVLLVCSESPYPVVVGGFERLIKHFETYIFADYDVYLLVCRGDSLQALLHYGVPVRDETERARLLAQSFAFALLMHPGFDHEDPRLIKPLIERIPSFCFTQLHPNSAIRDEQFKGIIAHYSAGPHEDVLLIGGAYDPAVFYKHRQAEAFILCVGRIHRAKNQLELVSQYREKIYRRHGLPLYLVGGSSDDDYYLLVSRFVDNVSVLSTSDPRHLAADSNWRTAQQIAALCNRARMFVMASAEETFCLALIEAMACGTTCVVNGKYHGFDERDLRPHVFGNIAGRVGSTLDLLDEALRRDIRIDASEWVKKYALAETKPKLLAFIRARL